MEPNDRPARPGRILAIGRNPRHLVSVSLWRPFSRLHGRFPPHTLRAALEAAGFVYRHSAGIDRFLDGPGAKARDAVHVVFAGEKVRPEYLLPAPDVTEAERPGPYLVLALPALVRMKLTSFRIKDRMHLLDLIDVGLVDTGWVKLYPPELGARLQELIDHPDA
jgi:hypothetical protein